MEERIEPKVGVVIVAGGSGLRVGGSTPKQFQFLGQLPILGHTIGAFASALPRAELVVVLAEDRVDYWRNLSSRFDIAKHKVVVGGSERFYSVLAGINALGEDVDIIAVQDGARPLGSEAMIRRCVECAISNGSAIPVTEVSDSLREVSDDGVGSRALIRSKIRAVQTPQIFDAVILRRAYRQSYDSAFTDDASVVEQLGERVYLCEGERRNIKITTREDIALAQQIIEGDGE
ncbi:MAG: 2-C-methyl-D-erythritol 4-phosphate cytidylyltransferase [Rikenellaceae bacterium]